MDGLRLNIRTIKFNSNQFNVLMFLIFKFLRSSFLNICTLLLFLAPLGMYLNFKSTGKLFISKSKKYDWRCVEQSIDPIFGSKSNQCMENSNKIGLTKEFSSDIRPDNVLDILILGGSVAAELTTVSNIEKDLNSKLASYPRLFSKFNQIRVFNGSTAGAKAPSGLFTYQALEMLGYRFDAVIEIAGFNEIGLSLGENYNNNIHPIYPRLASTQILGNARIINQGRLDNFIQQLIWMHPLQQYLSSNTQFYQFLKVYITDVNERSKSSMRIGMNYLLPKDEDSAFEQTLRIWSRSVENLFILTNNRRVPYILVLQPNQYIEGSKIFNGEEKNKYISTQENEKIQYKLIRKKSWSLKVSEPMRKYYGLVKKEDFNIPIKNILDLRYIFKSNTNTLYKDRCCHMNKIGMDIFSSYISEEIIKSINDTNK